MVPQVLPEESPDFLRKLKPDTLYAAFGGGVGHFGANFAVFSFNGTNLWVDAGTGFATVDTPGLEKVLPDLNLMSAFRPHAIILTHAHEDHIGAMPYLSALIPEGTPVFLSPFTESLLKYKLSDSGIDPSFLEYHILKQNSHFTVGGFEISNFFMPHSIPQTFSVGMWIPHIKKKVYFTSDFKTEGVEPRHNRNEIIQFGPVDYCFIDSTGSLSEGLTPDERSVLPNIRKAIEEWPGRVFITTFSSQIERIREVYAVAKSLGRPVGLLGMSIKGQLRSAYQAGEFDIPPEELRDPSPKNKMAVWIVAGCQADPRSSFRRLADGALSRIQLHENDLLIYSSSMIPGNEGEIFQALNNVALAGVRIVGIDKLEPPVHASGHGRVEDILRVINWLKPKYAIPVHGDPLHFHAFESIVKRAVKSPKLQIVRAHEVYRLYRGLHPEIHVPKLRPFVEPAEIHHDFSLYETRKVLSRNGLCIVVVSEARKELVNLEYIGCVSNSFLDRKISALLLEANDIVSAAMHSEGKRIDKKMKERIHKLNMRELRKAPFVHIVYI